jgi:hypothetical protein
MPKSWDAEIDSSTEEGRRQISAKKMNDLAISSLAIAFTKEGIMRLVSKSKTKEWPDGLAYLVVCELNKCRPRDIISRVE